MATQRAAFSRPRFPVIRGDAPEACACAPGDASNTVLINGGSVIVSSFGEVLAGPMRGQEGVLTADIDLQDIVRGKYDLDVAGHYARRDIFRLHVEDAPSRPEGSTGG